MDRLLRISELARRAGVNVQTLRYYERRGVLPRPRRTAGGQRVFEPTAVEDIRLIKRGQQFGFSLAQIGGILSGLGNPRRRCADIGRLLDVKQRDSESRIASLKVQMKVLRSVQRILDACPRNSPDRACPFTGEVVRAVLTGDGGARSSAGNARARTQSIGRSSNRIPHPRPPMGGETGSSK